jgi:two-component system, cell cycle sensor histidine kinase and response regulator CckA
MPGMNGRELADKLVAAHPEPHVILMSGYSPETVFGDGLLAQGTPLLAKPFAREELTSRVQAALERRARDSSRRDGAAISLHPAVRPPAGRGA